MSDNGEPLVQGRVERVRDGVVEGWAWDPAARELRVELSVLLDGREVGATVAELPRPSLAAAGIGDGQHAFRFVLPETLARPGQHSLRVAFRGAALPPAAGFVVDTAHDEERWHGVLFIVESSTESQPAPIALRSEDAVEGRVEHLHNGILEGWAWDPGDADHRLELRISLDGQEVGTTVAELPRPSLEAAGIGDGAHAFRFVLPVAGAAPGPHTLRVQAGNALLAPATGFAVQADASDVWYAARFTVETGDGSRSDASAPLVGLEGWLFDGASGLEWSHDRTLAATELAVASLLEGLGMIQQRVAEQGVKLLVVLCPAKEHVYRELLPREVRDAIAQRPGELLIRGMLAHPILDALDLMPALRAGAEQHPVFVPTTPLLSDWGSYCAYRAIIKRIAMIVPGVEPPLEVAASEVRMAASSPWTGSAVLATDAGLFSCPPEELPEPPRLPVIVTPSGGALRTPQEHLARIGGQFVVGWEQPGREQLARALFVGAPSFEPAAEWAGRHFRFSVIVGGDVSVIDVVSLERPDIVVYLVDERSLLDGADSGH
jgi:SGNH hydrolase-like domain, acetyltransferase AlgX